MPSALSFSKWAFHELGSLHPDTLSPKPYLNPKKVCKIMAFMAIIMGLGPLFCTLLGFR